MIEFLLYKHLKDDNDMITLKLTEQEFFILKNFVTPLPDSNSLRKKVFDLTVKSKGLPDILKLAISCFNITNPDKTIVAQITQEAPPFIEGGSKVEGSGDFKFFTNYFCVWEGTRNKEFLPTGEFFYQTKRGGGCFTTLEEALNCALQLFI